MYKFSFNKNLAIKYNFCLNTNLAIRTLKYLVIEVFTPNWVKESSESMEALLHTQIMKMISIHFMGTNRVKDLHRGIWN